jgi:hypothetical protein
MDRKTQYDEWNAFRVTLSQADTARKMGVDYETVAKLEEVWGWPIAKRERWFRESAMSDEEKIASRIFPHWNVIFSAIVALEVARWIWIVMCS